MQLSLDKFCSVLKYLCNFKMSVKKILDRLIGVLIKKKQIKTEYYQFLTYLFIKILNVIKYNFTEYKFSDVINECCKGVIKSETLISFEIDINEKTKFYNLLSGIFMAICDFIFIFICEYPYEIMSYINRVELKEDLICFIFLEECADGGIHELKKTIIKKLMDTFVIIMKIITTDIFAEIEYDGLHDNVNNPFIFSPYDPNQCYEILNICQTYIKTKCKIITNIIYYLINHINMHITENSTYLSHDTGHSGKIFKEQTKLKKFFDTDNQIDIGKIIENYNTTFAKVNIAVKNQNVCKRQCKQQCTQEQQEQKQQQYTQCHQEHQQCRQQQCQQQCQQQQCQQQKLRKIP